MGKGISILKYLTRRNKGLISACYIFPYRDSLFKNAALPKIRGIPDPILDQLPSKSNTYQEFKGGTSKNVLIKENKTKRGINIFTAKCATK